MLWTVIGTRFDWVAATVLVLVHPQAGVGRIFAGVVNRHDSVRLVQAGTGALTALVPASPPVVEERAPSQAPAGDGDAHCGTGLHAPLGGLDGNSLSNGIPNQLSPCFHSGPVVLAE